MDDLSREYVVSYFERSLVFHGDRSEAVRWTPQGQMRHYKALLDVGDISGKKILDFGCGKGDLYGYLKERKIPVDYSGCDISERLISSARGRYPKADFRVLDLDRDCVEDVYDYIFMCGVFNLAIAGLDETIRQTLLCLFSHCKTALAFNALSYHDPKKSFDMHYVNPGELFAFAVDNLSPFVSLRHDRMRYDFTLFIYRNENTGFAAGLYSQ